MNLEWKCSYVLQKTVTWFLNVSSDAVCRQDFTHVTCWTQIASGFCWKMMRALWLDIVTELGNSGLESISAAVWTPDIIMNRWWRASHVRFLSSFPPPPLFCLLLLQLFYIFLSNFSQCCELLHADILFCFCLLNIWAALVMVADWKDQEPLFNSSLFV